MQFVEDPDHGKPMVDLYAEFDASNPLIPLLKKEVFDAEHGWDLGWLLLEPINIAENEKHEIELSKRLSLGQKALYFFWYLDADVTNGGFIQFYWNGNRKYLPAIVKGLELIGDSELLDLIAKADQAFIDNEEFFVKQMMVDDWAPLYKDIKEFDEFDTLYYQLHDATMEKLEHYARTNPLEFVRFEN